MKTLFDVPLEKSVIPGMESIRRTLYEETRQCEVKVGFFSLTMSSLVCVFVSA